ncbi:MAG TPA: hypothetical protein DEQ14_10830 [Treponema sp.]|nr:hypothetical protein [Treponema sp.]
MSSLNIKKLLDRFTRNWIAKAASVGIAVFLFVFHRMTTLETRFFSIPLIAQTSSEFVPASSYTRIVRVSIRGDPNAIYPIIENDIEAYVDLRKFNSEGTYSAPVQILKKGSALGLEPIEIILDPAEISVTLDRKASKYIPLSANLRGAVETGYTLESHTLLPNQVAVEGPAEVLNTVSELYTDYIDLDGRSEDFAVMVNILNRDPLIVIRGNGMTEFRGFVRRSVPVRSIEGIPIMPENLNPAFTVEIGRTGSVRLEGDQADLDSFVPPDYFLSVDCSGITEPGEYTVPVRIDLSEELILVRRDPLEIKINVLPGGNL